MGKTTRQRKQPRLSYGRLLRKLASEEQWIEDVEARPVNQGDMEHYGVILINRLDDFIEYEYQNQLTVHYSLNDYVKCILSLKDYLGEHQQYPIVFLEEYFADQGETGIKGRGDRIWWVKENLLKNFTSAQAILDSDNVINWILNQY